MANKLNGGMKEHLMAFRGVKIVNGKIVLSISKMGKLESACGKRYDGSNAVIFSGYIKSHPGQVCKNCEARFISLMLEADKLKKTL